METGERFTAQILDMNEDGAGFAKIGGMAVFVPGCVTGDTAEIAIIRAEKNFTIADCLNIIRRSPHRIEPVCADCGVCGGCTLCHVTYALENGIKHNTVRAAFRRAGLGEIGMAQTLSLPARTGYRNKMTAHFAADAFGYYRANTVEPFPFRSCALCLDVFGEIVLFASAQAARIRSCGPTSLEIRSGRDGLLVTLRAEHSGSQLSEFASDLKSAFPAVRDVILSCADAPDRPTASVADTVAGLDMRFSSEAFRQVNTPVFELLLEEVRRMAAEAPFTHAVDLYCGSGIIGLRLAQAFPEAAFTGVEINRDAVRDARENAVRNRISNIEFFAGDAAAFRGFLAQRDHHAGSSARPELVIVDPPRAGLNAKTRRELAQLSPARVIYVSCNPQTLARDCAALRDAGYVIDRATPVNMFPMTRHIETVVLMSRK